MSEDEIFEHWPFPFVHDVNGPFRDGHWCNWIYPVKQLKTNQIFGTLIELIGCPNEGWARNAYFGLLDIIQHGSDIQLVDGLTDGGMIGFRKLFTGMPHASSTWDGFAAGLDIYERLLTCSSITRKLCVEGLEKIINPVRRIYQSRQRQSNSLYDTIKSSKSKRTVSTGKSSQNRGTDKRFDHMPIQDASRIKHILGGAPQFPFETTFDNWLLRLETLIGLSAGIDSDEYCHTINRIKLWIPTYESLQYEAKCNASGKRRATESKPQEPGKSSAVRRTSKSNFVSLRMGANRVSHPKSTEITLARHGPLVMHSGPATYEHEPIVYQALRFMPVQSSRLSTSETSDSPPDLQKPNLPRESDGENVGPSTSHSQRLVEQKPKEAAPLPANIFSDSVIGQQAHVVARHVLAGAQNMFRSSVPQSTDVWSTTTRDLSSMDELPPDAQLKINSNTPQLDSVHSLPLWEDAEVNPQKDRKEQIRITVRTEQQNTPLKLPGMNLKKYASEKSEDNALIEDLESTPIYTNMDSDVEAESDYGQPDESEPDKKIRKKIAQGVKLEKLSRQDSKSGSNKSLTTDQSDSSAADKQELIGSKLKTDQGIKTDESGSHSLEVDYNFQVVESTPLLNPTDDELNSRLTHSEQRAGQRQLTRNQTESSRKSTSDGKVVEGIPQTETNSPAGGKSLINLVQLDTKSASYNSFGLAPTPPLLSSKQIHQTSDLNIMHQQKQTQQQQKQSAMSLGISTDHASYWSLQPQAGSDLIHITGRETEASDITTDPFVFVANPPPTENNDEMPTQDLEKPTTNPNQNNEIVEPSKIEVTSEAVTSTSPVKSASKTTVPLESGFQYIPREHANWNKLTIGENSENVPINGIVDSLDRFSEMSVKPNKELPASNPRIQSSMDMVTGPTKAVQLPNPGQDSLFELRTDADSIRLPGSVPGTPPLTRLNSAGTITVTLMPQSLTVPVVISHATGREPGQPQPSLSGRASTELNESQVIRLHVNLQTRASWDEGSLPYPVVVNTQVTTETRESEPRNRNIKRLPQHS